MACLDRKQMLSDEKIEIAFKIFDQDNSGYIELEEIKTIF